MNTAVHFSSATDQWATPQALFDKLHAKWRFTLDVCADESNAKCNAFFDREMDGLTREWAPDVCWMNPPYGREIGKWVAKAYAESIKGAVVVCLLPARTDTKWFQTYCLGKAHSVEFIPGRLKFGNAKNCAPFPSCIVVFK